MGAVLYELCALQPPFKAGDMKGLANKICKGMYSRIPSSYSPELDQMVGMLLKVNAFVRPTCDEIMKNKIVMTKMTETLNSIQAQGIIAGAANGLLGTIEMPRNFG